ncbi:MAG: glycosyltransferase family 2 protein [Clostridia bacterium]|nr:glycosyltransferase family 2 protein [Clostridia bacterium]
MSKYKYRISIIIPVYNTSKYLKKCLDSLLYQTLTSLEIIVVDDCSTESLDEIYFEYRAYENLVFLRNDEHQGPGGARNRGLEIAQGEYIGFCDSDDWVQLDTYEVVVNAMDKYSSDIGIISMERIYEQPTSMPYYICNYNKYYELSPEMALRVLFQQYDVGITIPYHCTNKIFRKVFLDDIGAKFEENIYFQGRLFTIYTFLKSKNILCIPDVSYKHYRRKNSVIQSFDEKHINDFLKSMVIVNQYLCQMNKFETYKFHYYHLCERSLDIIVKEIFEFVNDEESKKIYLRKAIEAMKSLVSIEDYFEYADAEKIRRHIQPHIDNTILV